MAYRRALGVSAFTCLDKLSVAPIGVAVVIAVAVVAAAAPAESWSRRAQEALIPLGSLLVALIVLWVLPARACSICQVISEMGGTQ